MKSLVSISLAGLSLNACGDAAPPVRQPFVVAQSEEQAWKARSARYEIEAWEGYGVPGGPTANVKLENARTVLQSIVDKCELGATTLVESTDGVITLHPELAAMNDEQVSCVRSFEQPGLIFRDKKAQ